MSTRAIKVKSTIYILWLLERILLLYIQFEWFSLFLSTLHTIFSTAQLNCYQSGRWPSFFLKEEMGSSRTLIAYSKSQACNYEMFNLFSFIFIFSSNSRDDNLKIFLFLFFFVFFLEFLAVISHKTVIHTLILNEVNFFIHLLAFFFRFVLFYRLLQKRIGPWTFWFIVLDIFTQTLQ